MGQLSGHQVTSDMQETDANQTFKAIKSFDFCPRQSRYPQELHSATAAGLIFVCIPEARL